MTRIPNTNTTVSYAYTIKAAGKPIGTLQGFTPTANRQLDRVREIMNELVDTVEIVPGRSDFSLSIDRFETYDASMMEVLGFDGFTDLSQVVDPFQIVEEIRGPVARGGKRRIIVYEGCWIQSITKTVREGQTTVNESVTVQVTRIIASPLK
jgi:hypothetical protein